MNPKRWIGLLSVLALGVCAAVVFYSRATAAGDEPLKARVYELRTYHTHPGKLPDLHKRFREHTNPLFVKHGITMIGYWTPVEGDAAENTLVYLIAHDSMEAAKKSWDEFKNDPEWQKAYQESHANGPIVEKVESVYLNPTDYSPLR